MRQIINKKLIISILIALFICCNFVDAKNDNYFSINEKSEEQIDLGSAEKIAYMKLDELEKAKDYFIDDIRIIYNDDYSKELFFIFKLFPKGFMVISANYDLPPIIAYSFKSNINENANDDFLIELLKADINLRLENIEKIPDYILHERNSKWDKYLLENNDDVLYLDFEQWPPEGTSPTDGWIITTWNQKSPYNDFCPLDPSSGTRSIAGCPAVTMAQILNYHKTINNVFFNDTDDYPHNYVNIYLIDNDHEEYDFPSFPELNEYLSVLNDHYINDIVLTNEDKATLNFACGVAAKQVYTGNVSGTFGVNQAYDAYIKFNCDMIELIDDDSDLYDRISQNIKQAYPVHLAVVTPAWDSGHNLIIDGYNTDEFYHLNFGWGGQSDAWYLLPDEIPYGLTVIEGVIVDIFFNDNRSDLSCNGKLSWIDVSPGTTLYGNFTVENIGVSESFLNWSIESVPDWGTWEFTPSEGNDLTPEDEPVNVSVKVIAPDNKGKEFMGGIKIVNEEFRGDSYYIQVSLITPKIHDNFNIDFYKFFVKYQNLLPKILNYFFIIDN